MVGMTGVVALLGGIAGLGLVTALAALRGFELPELGAGPSLTSRIDRFTQRLAFAAAGGVGMALLTRWPVGALLVAAAGFTLPTTFGGKRAREAQVARIEAVAAWAEMLRDTMAAAGGLEQSILATAGVAPTPIRTEVLALAARLERERLAPALREFADQLDDPTGDLVVAALLLAADKSPKHLGDLLGTLAASARSEVNMRLRVESGRARTRTSVRVVIASTIVFSLGLVLFNRGYLDPYDSALGQFVLALVGFLFGASFYWLARTARIEPNPRFLTTGEAT
jgi:tight adherence protein B